MLVTWVSTVRSVSHSRAAMPALVCPSAIRASTSRSRGVAVRGRVRVADQRADDLGVEGGPAGGDATQCVEEVVDVEARGP